jgi:hypothetical protein
MRWKMVGDEIELEARKRQRLSIIVMTSSVAHVFDPSRLVVQRSPEKVAEYRG